MNISSFRSNSRYQHGAALLVGLIMLLLLTLIGVAGMRDTLLQEKMASNMRDREIALQAAESALRAGETQLAQINEPDFGTGSNKPGLYDLNQANGQTAMTRVDSSSKPITEQSFWQQTAQWAAGTSIVYPYSLDDVINPPRYVIERLSTGLSLDKYLYSGGGNGMTDSTAGVEVPEVVSYPDYRVTARGQGTSAEAIVILQSTYRRSN